MDRYPPDILHIQRSVQNFDIGKCKLLAAWLAEHIENMDIDRQKFKMSINQLNLSVRTHNVLRANNIITIGELLYKAVNWDNIRVLKGAGEKVVRELQETVTELRKNK